MNKPLIITIAVTILLLALGSWLYLFLFGAPQTPDEIFTDLGIVPSNEQTINPVTQDSTETSDGAQVDVTSGNSLQQLTLRPTAGFVSTGNNVRYVEQGTGHVYEIDLTSGNETRLSNATVPTVVAAHFNPAGTRVALISETPEQRNVVVGTIANNTLTTNTLPPMAENITFLNATSVAYTITENNGTAGYIYNTETESQLQDFRAPLRSVHTTWGTSATYVLPKPAVELEGAIFNVSGTSLNQIGSAEFGLTAEFGDDWYAVSFNQNNELRARAVNTNGGLYELPVAMVPEKCDWSDNTLYCAAPFEITSHRYIEQWYKGAVRSADELWRIAPATETAVLLANPNTEVGRPLDITHMTVASNGDLLFINRLDNTLWLYDSTTE